MSLTAICRELKNSIIAFVPKYRLVNSKTPSQEFPSIIGTGFVVHEDGLIATNAHVVQCFKKIFKPKDTPKREWPVLALLLIPHKGGLAEVFLDISYIFFCDNFIPGKIYYGPKKGPDLAFVKVDTKGLKPVVLDGATSLEEGTEVGTVGFPMGTTMLTAPGWLHQITPTFQKGIVSAVHPFFSPTPHSYSINIMVQGGASGSPVFACETGKVIGIISSSLYDFIPLRENGYYKVPTNISYAVPSHYIIKAKNNILENNPNIHTTEVRTLTQRLEGVEKNVLEPGMKRPCIVRKIENENENKGIMNVSKIDTTKDIV